VVGNWRVLIEKFKPQSYGRRPPLILVNGLSEQAESWFRNHAFWRRHFDVHMPNILVYEGEALHERIDDGLPIDVDYLVGQLRLYLDRFVQAPPYHLVASSLGGKVAVEYAVRYPERVGRIVLLCPSGMGDDERLPLVDGVRRSDLRALVASVFSDPRQVDPGIITYYRQQFSNKRWRSGLLRTIRGTMDHCVHDRLASLVQPTLLVAGAEDRIVDPEQAEEAAQLLPNGRFVSIPQCGHAPQMEKPGLVNRLVLQFLTSHQPIRPPIPELQLSRIGPVD
jgi:pimeloyl-ACP methyl ester carboxylesterase